MRKEEIIEQYIKSGEIMHKSTLNGDFIRYNSESRKIRKIYKYLEKKRKLATEILTELLSNPKVEIRELAASHLLALKIKSEEAKKVLEELIQNTEDKVTAFEANFTLKLWKKEERHIL